MIVLDRIMTVEIIIMNPKEIIIVTDIMKNMKMIETENIHRLNFQEKHSKYQ